MKSDEFTEKLSVKPALGASTRPAETRILGVMAKYWTPGTVKTRLGHTIGMEAAAAIHQKFALHLADSLAQVADQRFFSVTPADSMDPFRSVLPAEWEVTLQADGDLGNRIGHWFHSSLPAERSAVQTNANSVLIGADCPLIDQAIIEAAFFALRTHDVVLGPASDGGYYLIGLRGPWNGAYQSLLDGIPWSSDQVFNGTVSRVQKAGLTLRTLDQREDIDTIIELDRLRKSLQQTRGHDARDEQLAAQLDTILSGIQN